MTTLRRFLARPAAALLIAAFMLAAPVACAPIVNNLPKVVAVVQDAELVVDSIASFASIARAAKPDLVNYAKIDAAIAKARAALDAALRTTTGVEHLTEADIDAAFADFRAAYSELVALAAPLGVRSGGAGLRAAPGQLDVPDPMALTFRIGGP